VTIGDTLYFEASGPFGRALHRSDGSEQGTVLVAEFEAGFRGSAPHAAKVWGDHLYFAAVDGNRDLALWRVDSSGAVEFVRRIAPAASGLVVACPELAHVMLYFSCGDDYSGRVLWRSDGTAAGTRPLLDLPPATESSLPGYLTPVGTATAWVLGSPVSIATGPGQSAPEVAIETSDPGLLVSPEPVEPVDVPTAGAFARAILAAALVGVGGALLRRRR
jgi:ELWxxDGT repeat protein